MRRLAHVVERDVRPTAWQAERCCRGEISRRVNAEAAADAQIGQPVVFRAANTVDEEVREHKAGVHGGNQSPRADFDTASLTEGEQLMTAKRASDDGFCRTFAV